MGLFRVFFYGSLVVGTFVALHFTEPELYSPVRTHPLYEDFVTPVMTQMNELSRPVIKEIMTNPHVMALLGQDPVETAMVAEQRGVSEKKAPNYAGAEGSLEDDDDSGETVSRLHQNLAMPSQMGFSLAQLGERLKKRSVLSTEGSDSTYFEMPDGSRLWLQQNSVVEVGWTDTDLDNSELLVRVERGMMHIERPGAARGKVYLVTNSGVRYALAPSDGWMATAQMGPIDKDVFPDAELRMMDRSMDYVRRATLGEARELAKLLRTDGRREAMLYQDQLRVVADNEERRRARLQKADILPGDIASVPLEIPTRRGGRDLSREGGRMPASVVNADLSTFPSRGPASVVSLDEGTRIASEATITKLSERGQCSDAKRVFDKLRKEHHLPDSDTWVLRMRQRFSQRCP
jgi:hypothetical protein